MIPFHSLAVNTSPSILTPSLYTITGSLSLLDRGLHKVYSCAMASFVPVWPLIFYSYPGLLASILHRYSDTHCQWIMNQCMAATTYHWKTPPECFQNPIISQTVSSNYGPQVSNKSWINHPWLPQKLIAVCYLLLITDTNCSQTTRSHQQSPGYSTKEQKLLCHSI